MALPLLVALAQQRRRIARSGQVPEEVKLIAHMYDTCQSVLFQVIPARLLPWSAAAPKASAVQSNEMDLLVHVEITCSSVRPWRWSFAH